MSIDPIGNCPQWVKSVVKYIAKNVVKPVVKTVQKALSKLNLTYSRGYNISGSPGLLNFNAQIGVSADTKGNIAIQATGGYGVTTGSPSGSITGYTSMTNAKDISALEGLYFQLGGTIAVPILEIPFAFGGDMMILPNQESGKNYFGLTRNLGFGTPGQEFHVEWGSTATLASTRINLYDIAQDVYRKILEW